MIVTSFGPKGFEEYGRRFIETFIEHWPDERLTVYHEGEVLPEFPRDERVEYRDLLTLPGFIEYGRLVAESDPVYRGMLRGKEGPVYNFRFDVYKFFRKIFAITHYDAEAIIPELFAWVDADVVFKQRVPDGFLRTLLGGKPIAHLGRPGLHSECGFIAWDPMAPKHNEFMRTYGQLYWSGAVRYLAEWHDSWAFDFVLTLLEIPSRNLAKGCDPNHPFVYSQLGLYMDHLKGPERKARGSSQEAA
jgi:hypothetical protein